MIYIARTQKTILGLLLILVISMTMKNFSGWVLYLQLLFAIFILGALFTAFTFEIHEGYLAYQILIFTLPIYKKVIYSDQLIHIKFKRVSWATKGAILQMNKGCNVRIVHFSPNKVWEDLIAFATEYDIPISKTKDYLILDKIKKSIS